MCMGTTNGAKTLFTIASLLVPAVLSFSQGAASPNIVVFFGDDWGYGDLGANSPEAAGLTPHLDTLAEGGLRFTDFHVAASVCTPSRAGLLTGRLGLRTGVYKNFGTDSKGGLPLNETTIAELLKQPGADGSPSAWTTGMVGKWHLGTANGHHPSDRGFDFFVGLPYSWDMGCGAVPAIMVWPNAANGNNMSEICPACQRAGAPAPAPAGDECCGRKKGSGCPGQTIGVPLFHNKTIVEQPVNLDTLSARYGDAAETFIGNAAAAGGPFFLYYAAAHMHVPQNHDARWDNASAAARARGAFGAALMEMDDEVGRVMAALEAHGVADNTLFLVTGDNGPWECKCQLSGSSGPFSGLWQKNNGGGSSAKTTLWEGGHRVVGLAHWPARIAAGGVTNALASSLDYLPTIAAVAGIALPGDRSFDGIDLSPVMAGRHAAARAGQALTAGGPPGAAGGHTELLHPLSGACGTGALDAVRQGRYKAMWSSGGAKGCLPDSAPCVQHAVPLLFDLTDDPAEEHALDATDPANAAIIASLTAVRAAKMADIDGTPRSTADYGSSAAGRAANCCNNTNMECACSLW